jgi:hypothetical protein
MLKQSTIALALLGACLTTPGAVRGQEVARVDERTAGALVDTPVDFVRWDRATDRVARDQGMNRAVRDGIDARRLQHLRAKQARIKAARIKAARIKAARIKAARIKAARIKAARIKAARVHAARNGRGGA